MDVKLIKHFVLYFSTKRAFTQFHSKREPFQLLFHSFMCDHKVHQTSSNVSKQRLFYMNFVLFKRTKLQEAKSAK